LRLRRVTLYRRFLNLRVSRFAHHGNLEIGDKNPDWQASRANGNIFAFTMNQSAGNSRPNVWRPAQNCALYG